MLRWLTAGESHGPALVATIEGLPAGVAVTREDLGAALARRRLGYGRGARMKFEQDAVTVAGGVRHGLTLGSPVAIHVGNTEWPKWQQVMAPGEVDADELAALARNAPLTRPRPGHADLAGMQKYDFEEARPVLERASARETAARVALGAVASAFLEQATGARIVSHVVALGGVHGRAGLVPGPDDVARLDLDLDHPARDLGEDGDLHLHRLLEDDLVPDVDGVAHGHADAHDVGDEVGDDVVRHRGDRIHYAPVTVRSPVPFAVVSPAAPVWSRPGC